MPPIIKSYSALILTAALMVALMHAPAQAATISKAEFSTNKDRIKADYKVAIEKCDALAGDAKAKCVAAAKLKFGKS